MKKTRLQEEEEARLRIANHTYVEDVDERTRIVKIDKEARWLLKKGTELRRLYEEKEEKDKVAKESEEQIETKDENISSDASITASNKPRIKVPKLPVTPKAASPYPKNNLGYQSTPQTRRPRWKYAAQIINTYALENPTNAPHHSKKAAARAKARRHGRVVDGNTLIEHDGKLRIATVAELEQTSWKHVRNESEFMFRGVKEAWLRRELEGEVGGWGRQMEVNKEVKLIDEESLIGVEESDNDEEGGIKKEE